MLGLGLNVNKGSGVPPEPFDYTVFDYSADVIASDDGWQSYSVSGTGSTLLYNQGGGYLGVDGWMELTFGETQTNVVGVEYIFDSDIPPGATPTIGFDIALLPTAGWDPENNTDQVSLVVSLGGRAQSMLTTPGQIQTFSAVWLPTTAAYDFFRIYVYNTNDLPNAGSSLLLKNVSISF